MDPISFSYVGTGPKVLWRENYEPQGPLTKTDF